MGVLAGLQEGQPRAGRSVGGVHPAPPEQALEGAEEALTFQNRVKEEARAPLEGGEAREPGGEGRQEEHGSQIQPSLLGPGLLWRADVTGQRCP